MNAKSILHITGFTIALGIIVDLTVFIILILTDKDSPLNILIADFTNKFTWTYIVCVSIAAAKAVTKNNVPATGLAGLIAVPPA